MKKLQELLKHHDWHYQMSDDSTYFNKGERSKNVLYAHARNMPATKEVIKLWETYAPKQFAFPGSVEAPVLEAPEPEYVDSLKSSDHMNKKEKAAWGEGRWGSAEKFEREDDEENED